MDTFKKYRPYIIFVLSFICIFAGNIASLSISRESHTDEIYICLVDNLAHGIQLLCTIGLCIILFKKK